MKTSISKIENRLGYARSHSTPELLQAQTNTLLQAGCSQIITEINTTTNTESLLKKLEPNSTLFVTQLAILGLPLPKLIHFLNQLSANNIIVHSIEERISTQDTLIQYWLQALATTQRKRQQLAQGKGLEHARARGRHGGRPARLDNKQVKMLKTLANDHTHSIEAICTLLNISRATYYRYLQK